MKHRVSTLEGALLDAAVAKADGIGWHFEEMAGRDKLQCVAEWGKAEDNRPFKPSAEWQHGGPIIERERISLRIYSDGLVTADVRAKFVCGECTDAEANADGATPLIAAMRAYVASKYGDEIDL